MMGKRRKDTTEFFLQTVRMDGKISGTRSFQTMTAEERERAKRAAVASAETWRNGARQRFPAVGPAMEASPCPISKSHALILADQLLNRLLGYARKGSPKRKNFYRRDLNWIADVLMSVEAGEPDPLRPSE